MATVLHPPGSWRWFGTAGHFICARDCRFHLCTEVGPWLVSTVGEYWPPRAVREIHAEHTDPAWLAANRHRLGDNFDAAYGERFGYEEIGHERTYETMVFRAGPPCVRPQCECGLPEPVSYAELDFAGYTTRGEAQRGHEIMCVRWAMRAEPETTEKEAEDEH